MQECSELEKEHESIRHAKIEMSKVPWVLQKVIAR